MALNDKEKPVEEHKRTWYGQELERLRTLKPLSFGWEMMDPVSLMQIDSLLSGKGDVRSMCIVEKT